MTDNATLSPTATPNKCQELLPGDIVIMSITSDNPDIVALFPLVDIYPEVGALYVTDNAWNGTHLLDTESTIQIVVPAEGFFFGKFFGYGPTVKFGDNWTIADFEPKDALFDVSTRGDQLFLYCLATDGSPHFLWGMSYNGPWRPKGGNSTVYGSNSSALPDALAAQGNVVLDHCDNYLWQDPTPKIPANRTVQLAKLSNPDNYLCDNEIRFAFDAAPPSASLISWLVVVIATAFVTWRM